MSEQVCIQQLMEESGVKFGTSGARGLVSQMTDRVCVAYTLGLLSHLQKSQQLPSESHLAIGGDRRPSTPRILRAVAAAAKSAPLRLEHLGLLPSPAVALHGMDHGAATVMVTGSHIPADRNGMKFTTPTGEITKEDEEAIRKQVVELPDWFDKGGMLQSPEPLPDPSREASVAYERRYENAFPAGCLEGFRLGVYGHSAVGRDLLVSLYRKLGAEVVSLGFSEEFIPVDTEAIRPEDVELARKWATEEKLDALLSTDGDSDRPLIADEKGTWFRGDVAGIHTARYFSADAVAAPVSCNGALEMSGSFSRVARTRIGSPFVIEGMHDLAREGAVRVVGYEANGGFLHASPLTVPGGGALDPLPTRDPIIVHLALLLAARDANVPLSRLNDRIPQRITASGRDTSFDPDRSRQLLGLLGQAPAERLGELLGLGPVESVNDLDGLRITFASREVVHLRPSGNAPELRCYSEAASEARALELVDHGLARARELS